MHQLTITPPLDAALVLGLPLAVLWHNNNRFYGSFDAALGYREEVEKIGTLSSLRGQLFVFDEECFFAVPNMLRRSGQFSVLCQFMMTSLCVKKSAVEPARIFIIAVPGKDSAGIPPWSTRWSSSRRPTRPPASTPSSCCSARSASRRR